MNFRLVSIAGEIVEVEQITTGHRLSFSVTEDRADLLRGAHRENPAFGRLTKTSWKGGYLHARRCALMGGLIDSRSGTLSPNLTVVAP